MFHPESEAIGLVLGEGVRIWRGRAHRRSHDDRLTGDGCVIEHARARHVARLARISNAP
jgi:hypothetical protein